MTLQICNWFLNRREVEGEKYQRAGSWPWLHLSSSEASGARLFWMPEALGEPELYSAFPGPSQQSWFCPTAKMRIWRPEGQSPQNHT